MNNLKSLNLNKAIYAAVVELSIKTGADLNSVEKLTDTCIKVGYHNTGKIILIRENKKGVLIESFEGVKVSDLCIESKQIDGVFISNRRFNRAYTLRSRILVRLSNLFVTGNISSKQYFKRVNIANRYVLRRGI